MYAPGYSVTQNQQQQKCSFPLSPLRDPAILAFSDSTDGLQA